MRPFNLEQFSQSTQKCTVHPVSTQFTKILMKNVTKNYFLIKLIHGVVLTTNSLKQLLTTSTIPIDFNILNKTIKHAFMQSSKIWKIF